VAPVVDEEDVVKAVVFSEFGGPEVLRVEERPAPEPGPGEVRVAVVAAAVGPTDLMTRAGVSVQAGLSPAPDGAFERGLGWDFVGRVDAVGAGTDRGVGDEVVGLFPAWAVPTGAQAEQVVLPAAFVAPAPTGIEASAAATLPLNGLTAAAAIDHVPAEGHLLVLGGAGGIGWLAVQLALRAGLRVTATARPEDAAALRGVGAEVVARDALPTGVDAVLDTAGTGTAALAPLRDGGTLVTTAGGVEGERGIHSVQALVKPDGERLAELSALVEKGELVLQRVVTLPLEEVAQAHRRLAAGGVGARLVLLP
jgi:NADPH:quinone reductase